MPFFPPQVPRVRQIRPPGYLTIRPINRESLPGGPDIFDFAKTFPQAAAKFRNVDWIAASLYDCRRRCIASALSSTG